MSALDIALDRDAEVPVGTQLAWALRSGILSGELAAGARLPALHRLAEQTGVNVNTIRAVYGRLERQGLVATRHGSGTFVSGAAAADPAALAQLIASARDAARTARLDLRDVAAALYIDAEEPPARDEQADERRRLRAQIAALEQTLSDLIARRPGLAPPAVQPSPRTPHPRLLDIAGLTEQRDALVQRLAAVQTALGSPQ